MQEQSSTLTILDLYEIFNTYLTHIDKARPNWKDILLVGEVLLWYCKKITQFGIFVFVEAQI